MKKYLFLLAIFVLAIPLSLAQDDAEITWELLNEDAISEFGAAGTWNSTYNEPGAVIYHEGQYHMFVNGYAGFPANTGIGYKVSDDGINYEWVSDEPLFSRDDAPGNPVAIATTDVIILEDGTWVLYYYNFNSSAWPRVQGTIGRVTASDPLGEWTFDEEPVLISGEDDSWDENSVVYVTVTQVEDAFVMYYIGEGGTGHENLGRATSEDGITWEKDPEPVLVIDPELGEANNFIVNEVVYDGERWILAYKSQRAGIGFAFSEDGITWERYADNPIITAIDLDGINGIGFISLLLDDDGNAMLFIEGNVGNRTQIYVVSVNLPD